MKLRLCGTMLLVLPSLLGGAPNPALARALDIGRMAPYLSDGPGRAARSALRAGRYKDAARLLKRRISRSRSQRQQARFLLAYALFKQQRWGPAAARFRSLVRSYPLLRDYARFYSAIALFRMRKFSQSLRLAQRVSQSSGAALDARLLEAETLQALGRVQQAERIWRAYLEDHPKGHRRAEARYYIALALDARAKRAREPIAQRLRREALSQLKLILVRSPLSKWKDRAQRRLEALTPKVPDGETLVALAAQDLYERSLALYRSMRNVAAERGFKEALAAGLAPKFHCRACYYRAHSAYKQRQRARAAELFAPCVEVCKQAGETLFAVKCLYNRARGLRFKGSYTQAIATFGQIERDYPQHSYADDARLLSAEILAKMDRKDEVEQRLSSLPKDYPAGDMAREAVWRLALQSYLDGKLTAALRYLDQDLALGPAKRYYAAGRALYWKARIRDRQRRHSAARKLYERTVRDYPVSYYALMALNRLREGHRASFRKLQRELIRPVGRQAGSWTVPRSKLTRSSAFRRGIELARLGFAASAGRELARAGVSVNQTRDKSRLWLAAALYDRAQLWQLSHTVPRYRDHSYQQRYPLKQNVRRWRLSYPFAYKTFVGPLSRKAGISPYLTLAVMREESAFKTDVESYANAIGLMQLILPTARAAGKFHGMSVGRPTLKDPASNIRLGTTYLAFLRRSFGKLDPLAIAGYNAGHGAVFRWLKQFRGNKLDELLERVPYDQTRRYTKRVLSSLFAYQLLYERRVDRRVPRISQRVPRLNRLPTFAAKTRKKSKRKRRRRRR